MPGSGFRGVRGQHSGIVVVPSAVRRAREEADLSQAKVGRPQFTRAAVYMVEAGRMKPSKRLLRQIAQRTGRPISYFLPDSQVSAELREATDELHRLVVTEDFKRAIAVGEDLLKGTLPREVEA